MSVTRYLLRAAQVFVMCLTLAVLLGFAHVAVLYTRLPPSDGAYQAGLVPLLLNPFVATAFMLAVGVISLASLPLSLYLFDKMRLPLVCLVLLAVLTPVVMACTLICNTVATVLITAFVACLCGCGMKMVAEIVRYQYAVEE